MIISKTSQYAIQALIYLAMQETGKPNLSRVISAKLGVPPAYLSKILQSLCHGGLVSSCRGKHGGFLLNEAAENISLMRILQITEGETFSGNCVLGLKKCSDGSACPMHQRWMPIKQDIVDLLNRQTLASLSQAVRAGHYRICDIDGCSLCPPISHAP